MAEPSPVQTFPATIASGKDYRHASGSDEPFIPVKQIVLSSGCQTSEASGKAINRTAKIAFDAGFFIAVFGVGERRPIDKKFGSAGNLEND